MRSALSLLTAASLSVACAAPSVDLRAGYLRVGARGTVALEPADGGDLQPIHVEDELGVGAADSMFGAVALDGELGRVAVSGFRYRSSGAGVLGQSFGDIPAGTVVESDLTFDNVKALWTFGVLDLDAVRIGPGIGVDWFAIDTRVRSVTAISVYERIDVTAPVPMLFVRGEAELGPVALELEAGGITLDVGDLDGTFWDLEGRLVLRPVEGVDLFVGYRRIDIDSTGRSEGDRYDADVVVDGWTLGAGFRF